MDTSPSSFRSFLHLINYIYSINRTLTIIINLNCPEPIQYEISSAFRNFSGFGAGTVDTPFEGPTGKSDFAQPVHDNQRPDGQEEEVNLSGERVSLLGALDVEDEANVAAQDPAVWAHDAKADVALVKPMPTTTALTPSKKRAADRNVAQLEFAATGVEVKASNRMQYQILTDHVLVLARQILATAQETSINLLTMPGPQLQTHLLDILHNDRLTEVLEMWEPTTGFIDFDIMYNVPASAPPAQHLLVQKWRVYSIECWVLAMACTILLRAK
ncbi:hypothetical protein E2P81_ATG03531 [Venturia nashicola]|nr:hypothetical protein E2P81_ATG03531 [Venturia nashicola]